MLSRDEIDQRAIRLNPGRPVNRYTGTLNDPLQQAQSNYMGPRWANWFGEIQKQEEDAQDAGKSFRVGWGGFGNAIQEGDMPARSRYGSLAVPTADDGLPEGFAGNLALSALVDQNRARLIQDKMIANATRDDAINSMKQSYGEHVLASQLAPPIDPHVLTHDAATPGQSEKFTLRPDTSQPAGDPRAMLEHQIQRLPANHPVRLQMESQLAKSDALNLDKAKLDETKRHNQAAEEANAPFKAVTDASGAPVTGPAVLEKVPPPVAATVKAVLEGRQALPTGTATKDPYWKGIIGLAQQADPTFDAVDYNARSKTRQDFTSGAASKQINAINTVVGHLHDLADVGSKLDNTGVDWFNALRNKLTTGGSQRGVAINNFETLKEGVATELMRTWRQVGAGSEKEIEDWKSTISAAKSPQELQGAFKTVGGMLESKLNALDNQYKQGMGTDRVSAITPDSRAKLDALQGVKGGGGGTVRLVSPDGKHEQDVPADQVQHYLSLGAKRR